MIYVPFDRRIIVQKCATLVWQQPVLYIYSVCVRFDHRCEVNVDTSEQMFAFPAAVEFQTTRCQTRALFILLDS